MSKRTNNANVADGTTAKDVARIVDALKAAIASAPVRDAIAAALAGRAETAARKPAAKQQAAAKKPAAVKKPAKKPAAKKSSGMLTERQIAAAAKKAPKRVPAGTFFNEYELTCVVGTYPVKALAELDAREFMNTDVFTNRSALFPDARRFGILPSVVSVKVVPRPSDKLNGWALQATIDMTGGRRENRIAWAAGVISRCKAFQEVANAD